MNLVRLLFLVLFTGIAAKPLAFLHDSVWMVKAFTDEGSGANEDLSMWHPSTSSDRISLGVVAMRGKESRPASILMLTGGTYGVEYIRPTSFAYKWHDVGTGTDVDFSFWNPNCPSGFVPMGGWSHATHNTPSTNVMHCVKDVFSRRTEVVNAHIWWDKGSGGDYDGSVWPIRDNPNSWFASGYSRPGDAVYAPHIPSCGVPYISNSYSSNCGEMFAGGTCTFTCHFGYHTSSTVLNCGPYGFDQVPSCSAVSCNYPQISHSNSVSCDNTAPGVACYILCDSGYTPHGSTAITCQLGPSWDLVPTCEESKCPDLEIGNGVSSQCLRDGLPSSSGCPVSCASGYELLAGDDDIVTCRFGQWNKIPTCKAIPCGVPVIQNSDAAVSCGVMNPGDICPLSCDNGYEPVEADTHIACIIGPEWSQLPQCRQIPCPAVSLTTPYVSITCDTSVGSTCSTNCQSEYQLIGERDFIECQFGGLWTQTPICEEIPCGIPVVSNSDSAERCGTLSPGDRCQIGCLEGYELSAHSNIECLLGPAFTTLPECVPVPCPVLEIANSANSRNCGTSVGDECTILCESGYQLEGQTDLVHCEFGGTWSQLPTCERLVCPPLLVPHSTSTTGCEGSLSNTYCHFTCNEGFEKSVWNEIDARCNQNGEWELFAECTQIICEPLDVEFSNSLVACNSTEAGNICSFACNEDYEIRDGGNAIGTCDIVGQWKGVALCQEIIKCGVPEIRHSFAASNCTDWLSNTLCEFSCEENFDVFDDEVEDGDKSIFCNEFGEWDYLPECKLVLVRGRFPEETIEEEDLEFQNQANSAVKQAIDNLVADALFDNVPFEDVMLNVGGLDDPYTWFLNSEGKYEGTDLQHKILRIDRQPHANHKKFYDNYDHFLRNVLKLRTVTTAEELELESLYSQITAANNEFENLLNELYVECTSDENTATYGDDTLSCMEDVGMLEHQDNLQQQLDVIEEQIREAMYDAVSDLRSKLENHVIGPYHDWCAKPSPDEVVALFAEPSTPEVSELSISESTIEQDISVEDVFNPTFAAYRGGQFVTVKMKQEQLNAEIKMEFNKWARVDVSPGLWYDNLWMDAAQDPRYLHDSWTVDQEANPDKHPVWGPDGALNSAIAQFVVAQDVSIKASGNSSLVRELRTLYEDAESVKLGTFCSGKACATTVNVILDTYTPFPSHTPSTQNYLRSVINQVRQGTYRNSSTDNTIAILGSERSINNDFAGILFQMHSELDIPLENYYFYEGEEQLEDFFQDLLNGVVDPEIIWFSATENVNDLDQKESEVLKKYATALDDYTASGGGLIAHGNPDIAFFWLEELLPNFNITSAAGCDSSAVEISHAGRALLSASFTTELFQSIPCFSSFGAREELGNLEAFVKDLNGNFFVFGAYGGLTSGSSPLQDSDSTSQVYFDDHSTVEQLDFELNFVFDHPVILATYAPRFPHLLSYAGCETIEDES